MGGGILPVAKHNGKIYLFFGRETLINKSKDSGLWSDFGGGREKNETNLDTALREGHEELSGILGNKSRLKYLINKRLIGKISLNGYVTYLINIKYNQNLGNKLRNKYKMALKNDKDLILDKHNGLYEKDMGKWINIKYLRRNMDMFRPWYKYMVYKIIRFFNKNIEF